MHMLACSILSLPITKLSKRCDRGIVLKFLEPMQLHIHTSLSLSYQRRKVKGYDLFIHQILDMNAFN